MTWRKRTIMEMAREAGISSAVGKHIALDSDLERFAELVREEAQAEEREAIYKIVLEAPFRQNLETEPNGEDLLFAVKVMAFDITSAILARNNT